MLYEIVQWARTEGEVKALERLRVRVLPQLLAEGIVLSTVTPTTTCSPRVLEAVRTAASAIVGRPCPY